MTKKVTVLMNDWLCLLCVLCLMGACGSQENTNGVRSLFVFAGSASQPVLKEIAHEYRQQTGVRLELSFGGSGFILSQMQLTGRGDIYMPGSMDFMLKAVRKNLVDSVNICTVAYLVPAINVKPGNPKKILTLADLSRPGIRIGIARPEQVCLGLYAIELLEANNLLESVLPNLVVVMKACCLAAKKPLNV